MVERILEVTRVKRVERYNANQRSFEESSKKKSGLEFQSILNRTMKKNAVSEPYQVNILNR